MIDLAERRAY